MAVAGPADAESTAGQDSQFLIGDARMLILSRKAGDTIVIDGGIKIVVVQCDRGGVRIGIEAPAATTILRGELLEQVAAQNQQARAALETTRALLTGDARGLAPRRGTPALTPTIEQHTGRTPVA
jgi:carbon storage regulator